MQQKTLIFLIFILQFLSVQSQSPYQIKSCKIDFEFNNGIAKGTKTAIFTDSGRIKKEITLTYLDTNFISDAYKKFLKSINNRTRHHILNIQTEDSLFSIDLDSMLGTKVERFNFDMSGINQLKKNKVGKDTFLNKICEVVNFEGCKIWYWKGIALKKEIWVSIDQKFYENAIDINEKYIIREDEFKVPNGVKMKKL